MAAVSHVFALGNGGPHTKCLSWSEFRPQIANSSD